MLVFAVKPQVLGDVLQGMAAPCCPQALVLSIVAGATIATYRERWAPRQWCA